MGIPQVWESGTLRPGRKGETDEEGSPGKSLTPALSRAGNLPIVGLSLCSSLLNPRAQK